MIVDSVVKVHGMVLAHLQATFKISEAFNDIDISIPVTSVTNFHQWRQLLYALLVPYGS